MVEIVWETVLYRAGSLPVGLLRGRMALPQVRRALRVVPGLEVLGYRIPEPVPCLILQPVPMA